MGSGLKTSVDAQPKVIVSQFLSASEVAVYTCPPATSVKIMNASLCNTSNAPVAVDVSLVMTGGTAGDGSHRIVSGYAIAAFDSLPLQELLGGHVLGPGDVLEAGAASAAAVTMVVSAVVFA